MNPGDRRCCNCQHCDSDQFNAVCNCSYHNRQTKGFLMCPAYLMDKNKVKEEPKQVTHSQVVAPKRKRAAEPMLVRHDPSKPDMVPLGHQAEAIEFFKNKDDIALFFEMGCGKSFTTLQIAQAKYKAGEIQGLLVIAPNDVHRQWYDELVNGKYNELQIDFQAQCVGGRGGQKELYPFERDDLFKFVSVNIDTFSTPHKWEDIVFWANNGKYMIAVDEATVIKNPSSKRSQRLLYEFNEVKKRGRTIVSSVKRCPVRAVLTGTPVTNGPIDLWAIMEFVEPNFFGRNYYSFRAYYGMFTKLTVETGYGQRDVDILLTEKTWEGIHNCKDFTEAHILFGCSEDTYMTIKHQEKFIGPYKHAEELRAQLDKCAKFKKLTDCVDMPPCNYVTREVGMSDAQQNVYNSMKKQFMATFDGHEVTAKNKLVVSLRLQQIASGFIMGHKVYGDWDFSLFSDATEEQLVEADLIPDEVVWLGESIPKLDALMRDVAECDKPLLILTRYSAEAAKIHELCEKAGYRTGLFTGWKVIGGIDAFKEGKLDILVANSAKISRGFNLQNAHVTLFYSNTFSMEIRQQAEFRTFRMGQKEPCLYVDYVSSDVDKMIVNALQIKKNLLDTIRDMDVKEL